MSDCESLHSILLVEDDPDIQVIVRLVLESLGGFQVTVCGSGIEAIAQAPSIRPDLILMDIMMPEMDGLTTLAHLRATPELERTAVIFMTAKAQQRTREELVALGALDIIAKPFDPMTLASDLRRIWSKRYGMLTTR